MVVDKIKHIIGNGLYDKSTDELNELINLMDNLPQSKIEEIVISIIEDCDVSYNDKKYDELLENVKFLISNSSNINLAYNSYDKKMNNEYYFNNFKDSIRKIMKRDEVIPQDVIDDALTLDDETLRQLLQDVFQLHITNINSYGNTLHIIQRESNENRKNILLKCIHDNKRFETLLKPELRKLKLEQIFDN